MLKDYDRSSLFILTKVWAPMGDGPNDRGLSAKHIREQCDASLKRLAMDYVDVYMCHRPDRDTPLEETVRAMEDLARVGKILYWGISEWPAEMIVEANAIAHEIGARPMAVSQPRYNLLYRHPETDLFPTTRAQGIGNVTFSPLAHGMLTGKYKPGEEPAEGTRAADDRQNMVIKAMYWSEENKEKAQELATISGDYHVSAAELAIAWCLQSQDVSSVILGTSSVAQVEQNLKAVGLHLSDDVMKRLDELFPSPRLEAEDLGHVRRPRTGALSPFAPLAPPVPGITLFPLSRRRPRGDLCPGERTAGSEAVPQVLARFPAPRATLDGKEIDRFSCLSWG